MKTEESRDTPPYSFPLASERAPSHLTRDRVLGMLSDDQRSEVRAAESKAPLGRAEEYIDLQHLDQGVQKAGGGAPTSMVLPRKAVHQNTWVRIVAQLHASPVGPR